MKVGSLVRFLYKYHLHQGRVVGISVKSVEVEVLWMEKRGKRVPVEPYKIVVQSKRLTVIDEPVYDLVGA